MWQMLELANASINCPQIWLIKSNVKVYELYGSPRGRGDIICIDEWHFLLSFLLYHIVSSSHITCYHIIWLSPYSMYSWTILGFSEYFSETPSLLLVVSSSSSSSSRGHQYTRDLIGSERLYCPRGWAPTPSYIQYHLSLSLSLSHTHLLLCN